MRVWTKKLMLVLAQPFRVGNGFDIGLVSVFLCINGLVLVNVCFHDPRIGYDARGHLDYIQALSHLRLVTPEDTAEFFSPPLPYAFPALLIYLTGMHVLWAAKLSQLLNFLLSVGLSWYLIKACDLINSHSAVKLGALAFLGILPVYYKTFSFVRGEPYVAFFATIVLYHALLIARTQFTFAAVTRLGTAMGLCALSRQWGILLFPSVFVLLGCLWIRLPELRRSITRAICLCLLLILVISAWFYASLHLQYGSSTAFNRAPAPQFSLNNQPLEFYVGLSPTLLFNNPLRPNFPNQFFPIFYSEIWGDYWGYFSVYAMDPRAQRFVTINQMLLKGSRPDYLETNYDEIGAYLGRVNRISIFPSVLALVSMVVAAIGIVQRRTNHPSIGRQRQLYSFTLLSIGAMIAGYFWFLIMYPYIGKGDTIKATYVLHVFPFLAILVGIFLERIRNKSVFVYRIMIAGLGFVFLHNFFAMLTHYPLYRL